MKENVSGCFFLNTVYLLTWPAHMHSVYGTWTYTDPIAFFQPCHHDDSRTVILPDHSPEVNHSVAQRSLQTDTQTYKQTNV